MKARSSHNPVEALLRGIGTSRYNGFDSGCGRAERLPRQVFVSAFIRQFKPMLEQCIPVAQEIFAERWIELLRTIGYLTPTPNHCASLTAREKSAAEAGLRGLADRALDVVNASGHHESLSNRPFG